MKDLNKFKINPLYKRVVDEIIEDAQQQKKSTIEENIISWLELIQKCGLVSGVVSSMIYFYDTTKFYEKYKIEINGLLYETLENAGVSINELFGDKWETDDPLALDVQNQNLLAWFAYEEISYQLQSYLLEE